MVPPRRPLPVTGMRGPALVLDAGRTPRVPGGGRAPRAAADRAPVGPPAVATSRGLKTGGPSVGLQVPDRRRSAATGTAGQLSKLPVRMALPPEAPDDPRRTFCPTRITAPTTPATTTRRATTRTNR